MTTIVAALAALALVACGSGGAAPTSAGTSGSTAAADKAVSIGITQIVDHPSLNASVVGFKAALADAGYEVTYDEQNAQSDVSTAATIAGNFANADLDLVLAVATPTAQAAVQAITDVPVLFTAVTDPVGAGLVESMEAPGANVSGTSDANPVAEQLALVKELAPDATTVGIVYSSGEANSQAQVDWAKEAATDLGLTIEEATVTTSAEVQQATESLEVDAFYVITDNVVVSALESLLQVAETKKIPVIAAEGDSVARGSIATVGISYEKLGYQTGEMAAKILAGDADPATMPVGTQTDLDLYLNLGAAERQGVTVPQSLVDRADPANVTE
ncbi:MAG: ABC transporter substrate-binding protein [Propioniciclava sp.]